MSWRACQARYNTRLLPEYKRLKATITSGHEEPNDPEWAKAKLALAQQCQERKQEVISWNDIATIMDALVEEAANDKESAVSASSSEKEKKALAEQAGGQVREAALNRGLKRKVCESVFFA